MILSRVYSLAVRCDVLTLFPGMFHGPLSESILLRAREEGLLDLYLHDIRTFGMGKYRQVDDRPYGGGVGMVMKIDVMVRAIETVVKEGRKEGRGTEPWKIYLSPKGKRLTQARVEGIAKRHWLLLVCGHYEGIDQRVIEGGWIDEETSIGEYVLTGGELPAMVVIDSVARQIPGVLGKDESAKEESFSRRLERRREYPHYTRPEEFRGLRVPDILLSGDHAKIEKWRSQQLR